MVKGTRKLETLARLESWNDKLETGPQAASWKRARKLQAGSGWPAGTTSWEAGNYTQAGSCKSQAENNPRRKNFSRDRSRGKMPAAHELEIIQKLENFFKKNIPF